MAERRMFSLKIIDSDLFLDMPISAQNLYFHLAMRADDEGFVNNPRKIMRMIGASVDDAKVLLNKEYILAFDDGVIVIRHWRTHNYIQKDRFRETLYKDDRNSLDLQKDGSYTFKTYEKNMLDTECIQNVSNLDTQDSIGKDSIGKVRLDNSKIKEKNKIRFGIHANVELTEEEHSNLLTMYPTMAFSAINRLSQYLVDNPDIHYKSHYETLCKWIERDKRKAHNKQGVSLEPSYDREAYDYASSHKRHIYKKRNDDK